MPLPPAIFPGAVASAADLLEHANVVPSEADNPPTLAVPVTATTATLTVTAGTGAQMPADNFMASIEDEIVFVAARSGDTLTGCVRGAEGTAAASHASTAPVLCNITAKAHNQVAAEIIAIENKLASGGGFTAGGDLTGTGTAQTVVGLQGKLLDHATVSAPSDGQVITWDATSGRYQAKTPATSGGGSVTSVALSAPAEFIVSGSPVTSSGTLAFDKSNQAAHAVWAGPLSGATAPAFRALDPSDVPNLAESQVTGLTADLAAKAPLLAPAFVPPVSIDASGGKSSNPFVITQDDGGISMRFVDPSTPGEDWTISLQAQWLTFAKGGNSVVGFQGPTTADWAIFAGNAAFNLVQGTSGSFTNFVTCSATFPPGDNSNKLATTAFVAAAIAAGGGGGAVASVFGRTGAVVAAANDYSVGQISGAAPLASPALTGTPTAPTPTAGDNSTNVATTAFIATALGGGKYRLLRVVTVTSGTSYSPTTGAAALYVEAVGGGGGGGGGATTSSNASAGGGGGAGAYSAVWLTGAAVKTSYTIQVGAGGTGVAGGNGNAGTDTTFDSPSVCTAKGGAQGQFQAANTLGTARAGSGGSASGGIGDFKTDGGSGTLGIVLSASLATSGNGGSSMFAGGPCGLNQQNAGTAVTGYGAGGSGGCSINGAQVGGGKGGGGVIRVWEFI